VTVAHDAAAMPFLEHLRELRNRLIKSIVALGIGMALAVPLAGRVIVGLRDMCPACDIMVIAPTESVITFFRVAIILGLVVATPVILYQIVAFVSPGLLPHERRLLIMMLPGAAVLFATGMAFGYFVALPRAVAFLSGFLGAEASPNWTLSNYVAFVTNLLLMIGISFQTPLVVFVLTKLNLVTPAFLRHYRRHAIVLRAVLAAVLTPTPDPLTMILVLAPMVVLFEFGIVLSWFAVRSRNESAPGPASPAEPEGLEDSTTPSKGSSS
jgi:sec-independent protein translocase protein TatC